VKASDPDPKKPGGISVPFGAIGGWKLNVVSWGFVSNKSNPGWIVAACADGTAPSHSAAARQTPPNFSQRL
jgi:hypothetical protein